MADEPTETSCKVAGKRGGDVTKEKYGSEHYARLGEQGGKTTIEKYGSEHYARIGTKGGRTTSARYGKAHYAEIGKRGVVRLRTLIEQGKAHRSKFDEDWQDRMDFYVGKQWKAGDSARSRPVMNIIRQMGK